MSAMTPRSPVVRFEAASIHYGGRRIDDPAKRTYRRPESLYREVAAELRRRISSGDWGSDTPLPSEDALAAELGVGRSTIREAMRGLEHEGMISRRQGVGTFVSAHAHRISGNITAIEFFVDAIEKAGYEARLKTLAVQRISVVDHVWSALELPAGEGAWRLDNLYLANSRPAILTRSVIPTSVVPSTFDLKNDFQNRLVREYLRERWGVTVDYAVLDLEACAASDDVAMVLEVSPGYPLLSLSGFAVDTAGKRPYYLDAFINTALYKFSVLRR